MTRRLSDDVVPGAEPGTRDEGNRDVNGHEDRDGGGNGNGGENKDENKEGCGGERQAGNLRSDIRGGSEDAEEEATPTSNQQPRPQDLTSQRDRHIMRKAIDRVIEPRDGRQGTGSGRAEKGRKSARNLRRVRHGRKEKKT